MRLSSLAFLILFLLGFYVGAARCEPVTITAAEYYIDVDPGVGLAMPLSVVPDSEIVIWDNVTLTGLERGMHTLFIRLQDSRGVWSVPKGKVLRVACEPLLSDLEYYVDTDPGPGFGQGIDVSETSEVAHLSSGTLPPTSFGLHYFYVRSRTTDGLWSQPRGKVLRVYCEPLLSDVEYFFDIDPGLGFGQPIDVRDSTEVQLFASVPISLLQPGLHRFYARCRTLDGLWTVTGDRRVHVDFIAGGETYFDNYGGIGNGIVLRAEDGSFDEFEEYMYRNVLADTISLGQHVVYIHARSASGLWSNVAIDTVTIDQGESFKMIPSIVDSLSNPVRLAWPNIGATEYHVFYDSVETGPFNSFFTVAAPDTSLIIGTYFGRGKAFFFVTGYWEDDLTRMVRREPGQPGGEAKTRIPLPSEKSSSTQVD